MKHSDITLEDKYNNTSGRIFINGNQALVRLPLIQAQLDKNQGLNTAGYISGYRGSPLGALDSYIWKAKKRLDQHNITFQPGVNEDLAATAIWGTQLLDTIPEPNVDGVFAMWYGKGPGVDRSGDPFKHANYAGTHEHGGVLVVYGDDHPGKSSTISHQSEQALAANLIPSLYPADVSEFIDYGILGWALSRYSGLWVGFKCVNESVEQTATIDINLDNIDIKRPSRDDTPTDSINLKTSGFIPPQTNETNVITHRLPLVHRFIKANNLDQVRVAKNDNASQRSLGIVTAGKAYNDVMSALALLEIDNDLAQTLGLSVFKLGCIWPIEPSKLTDFAQQQPELLVIEEKRAFIEEQIKSILFGKQGATRVIGKQDENGLALVSADVQLEPLTLAFIIAERLRINGQTHPKVDAAIVRLRSKLDPKSCATSLPRTPYFCSGCPHNTSTKVPENSIAMAGIGCHAMAAFYRKDTMIPCHMGGEGMQWVGLAKYTNTNHVFQNLGDGTYYHSGLMAIRGAIAAKVNITYKILYNDAVAMTGGQPVDGPISVAEISQQVTYEGISKCVIVTDSPQAYANNPDIAKNVEIYHRDRLDMVQTMLSKIAGCTVLIYEQTCAAEKRRRRKRGLIADPTKRLYINADVCEGCGDCSVQSTCVSLQPKVTSKGIKRQIDQSSCNKDYSCNKGFCPSFVTVIGGTPKKAAATAISADVFATIPAPTACNIDDNYNVMIAGIGGSGVITVGAILGMAAHIDNKACSIYDMTGLSQKNGAVYSHLKFANSPERLFSPKIDTGSADLILAFDLLATLDPHIIKIINDQHTRLIGNAAIAPPAIFQLNPQAIPTEFKEQQSLTQLLGRDNVDFIDASNIAKKLMGDTIGANLFVVGFALQKGALPLSVASVEHALRLNGVSVDFNLNALNLGRLLCFNPEFFSQLLTTDSQQNIATTAFSAIKDGAEHLSHYQSNAYAEQYREFIEQVSQAEKAVAENSDRLTLAVATNLSKLMSYKDEYEVARLHSSATLMQNLHNDFDGDFKVKFSLAPPLFSKKHPDTGLPIKREFGPWILTAFKVLAKFKFLRGSKLDMFSYTNERKMERQLIKDYQADIKHIIENLNHDNLPLAIEIAQLPQMIKGFGHIKENNISATLMAKEKLLHQFTHGPDKSAIQFKEVS
ncbi:indolepyruvate ferredoxin oxidoreductase family protein [Shewanella sp. 4_MG-2023]|uniref:indolepyruvate ferredoxin oxidoreductase family protein n=1 Tax=Shewanella sp. 4_MG-2023 TaxID=3062652 RepID=UPI0026E225D3|nr:indolepyruvate ferredoxin oxidoreductase family protein [Shewanella sp. 4_MG-2023]MDO6679306.1 indolepyruvate ferredoxin oxidoreductase family protein [Shewanella sp. 4_MG-2023]